VIRITFDVKAEGPVFDGGWVAIMLRYRYALTSVLGQEAVNRIKNYLPTQYKYLYDPGTLHGTKHFIPGLYESDIHTDRQTPDINLVHDTPVVYGPWLEGVGSQNETTRFKGYHTFRRIAQQLELEASAIADRTIQIYIKELNG
jgi:hypothetical protein